MTRAVPAKGGGKRRSAKRKNGGSAAGQRKKKDAVQQAAAAPTPREAKATSPTYTGATCEVVASLIDDGDKAGVLSVVERLELQIKKLQLDMARLKQGSGRHSEGVSTDQLAMLFDELAAQKPDSNEASSDDGSSEAAESNETKLADLGELDKDLEKKAKNPQEPPSRPGRRPLPKNLPRVDNYLPVPEDQWCCPICREEMAKLTPRCMRCSTTIRAISSCAVTSERSAHARATTAPWCVVRLVTRSSPGELMVRRSSPRWW